MPLAILPREAESPLSKVGQAQCCLPSAPFALLPVCRGKPPTPGLNLTPGGHPNHETMWLWASESEPLFPHTETLNVDSSLDLFIWGHFALEVVTVDKSVWAVERQPVRSHGQLSQAELGLPSCRGRAGGPGPEARGRGGGMAGHTEHPACQLGKGEGRSQLTSFDFSQCRQLPDLCISGINPVGIKELDAKGGIST